MVNTIDIHQLTTEELSGVIDLYPWYGAARKELCVRMARKGSLSELQASESALYIGSRKIIAKLFHAGEEYDYKDTTAPEQEDDAQKPQIFIVGGDYFSQNDYDRVKQPEDNIFSHFATKAYESGYVEPLTAGEEEDICTETLAKIYLEQDYPEQAKDIYSKLILRYPEKSVYFANLIDEINKTDK